MKTRCSVPVVVIVVLGLVACGGGSDSGNLAEGGAGGMAGEGGSAGEGGEGGSAGGGGTGGEGGAGGTICEPGDSFTCYSGPEGTEGIGICHAGKAHCLPDGRGFGPCEGEQTPLAEECGPDDCEDACIVPECGNGKLEPGEECDDEFVTCSSDCQRHGVRKVMAGEFHSCAVLWDGGVKCWGINAAGQLGSGDDTSRGFDSADMGASVPWVDFGEERSAEAIAVGGNHNCAILDDRTVRCWGYNSNGQLGIGDLFTWGDGPNQMGDSLRVAELGEGRHAVALSLGEVHSCALLDDGSVKCWGSNANGQLGLGDQAHRGDQEGEMGDALDAVLLGTGRTATAIATGTLHTCAILDDGSVKCWGDNRWGQIGLGEVSLRGGEDDAMGDSLPAVKLGEGRRAKSIIAGRTFTCAILDDDRLKCWGLNDKGQLGLEDTDSRGRDEGGMGDALPYVKLGPGRTVLSACAGNSHACALLDDHSVKCWGANNSGKLGLGDEEHRGDDKEEMDAKLPAVKLGKGRSVSHLACGYNHTCAVLDDHSLKCWGLNDMGQLGIGEEALSRGSSAEEMGDDLPRVELY